MRDAIAVVDYGIGNLFSVLNAFERLGVPATVVKTPAELLAAPGVVLPGVGAMPDAMAVLNETGLAAALREAAARGTPMLGICLGLQLLMTEGTEFTRHAGLGLVEGEVIHIQGDDHLGRPLRVPHLGWNRLHAARPWLGTDLEDLESGTAQYFVHSFHVRPEQRRVILAETTYGDATLTAVISTGSILACQFHPERSGPAGLALLRRFAARAGVAPLEESLV